jgi:CHASE3 domain sensor protein
VKYLRIFVLVFVVLTVVVGLSFQEITNTENSVSESPEIVEAGGKIISIDLSDGVTGGLGLGER